MCLNTPDRSWCCGQPHRPHGTLWQRAVGGAFAVVRGMRAILVGLLVLAGDAVARAERCEDVPAPRPHVFQIDLLARAQVACRRPLEGAVEGRVATVVDATSPSSTDRRASLVAAGSGELAVNFASGFQLRAGGNATAGAGPSGAPKGGATLVVATPPTFFPTEVEQRVDLHGLPRLSDGRARAPGQRFDEVASVLRIALGSGDTGHMRAVMLPVTVERIDTYADADLTTWKLRVGMASAGVDGMTVDILDFRSEWINGEGLHHIELFDAHGEDALGWGRIRLGAADRHPTDDPDGGLAYSTWEGEFTVGARKDERGVELGFSSDCMLTTDGLLARAHRGHAGAERALFGGWLGASGYLERTSIEAPTFTREWTYGATGTYTRRTHAVGITASVEVGRSFHRRLDDMPLGPGFAATASLSITAAAGDHAAPNRMPD